MVGSIIIECLFIIIGANIIRILLLLLIICIKNILIFFFLSKKIWLIVNELLFS